MVPSFSAQTSLSFKAEDLGLLRSDDPHPNMDLWLRIVLFARLALPLKITQLPNTAVTFKVFLSASDAFYTWA